MTDSYIGWYQGNRYICFTKEKWKQLEELIKSYHDSQSSNSTALCDTSHQLLEEQVVIANNVISLVETAMEERP